jgi:hypothetical protein
MHETSTQIAEAVATELRRGLATLLRLGSATSADLVFETPEVLHALKKLGVQTRRRALEVQIEVALEEAIDDLPAADAEAARIMFGVDPNFRTTKLGERREQAAEVLGVVPGTFRNRHEDRLLDVIAKKMTLSLLPEPQLADHEGDGPGRDRSRVLLIHGHDSIGVKEVARLVERLGLEPILWQEALDRIGLMSPSVIERFRSCLDIAQGVMIVMEGGLGESELNLVFEAGLALGLAEERTVVVQLGDQTPPDDLAAVNILRLRSTEESAGALSAALIGAGCAIPVPPDGLTSKRQKGIDSGWYSWTPAHAESPLYADIATAVQAFQPMPYPGSQAAARWLKENSLEQYPGTTTYLLIGEGRLDGFVALRTGSIVLKSDAKPQSEFFGAIVIRWMARNREAAGKGEEMLSFATALATDVGAKLGVAALLLKPFDDGEALLWKKKFGFMGSPESGYLWMPLTSASAALADMDIEPVAQRAVEPLGE